MTAASIFEVRVPGCGTYPLHIAPGSIDAAAAICTSRAPAHRYAVIADSQVARLYGRRVLASFEAQNEQAELITFPAGEWNKTREQWSFLTDALLNAGFGRDSAFVALGGGVTGDLAGFVAATYMRGVPVIQIPTTLLAMLDSSVGGKTGVDADAGKNLIGVFHHPAAVVIDPEVLSTLPVHQRCAGLAEAVKTAAILDEDLWDAIQSGADALLGADTEATARLVAAVVSHKARVVEADPRESGFRAILNFGHTIGHALEMLEGYTLLHGEAVAAGMRVEARLGEALGITERGTADRLERLLAELRLDGEWESGPRPEKVVEAMTLDKKARRTRVRCVFLARIGETARDPEGRWTFELDDETLAGPLTAALRSGGRE